MGCRIIEGKKDGHRDCAVFYCSTTEWAFGPVMGDYEEAESFIAFLKEHPAQNGPLSGNCDPRSYTDSDLETLFSKFRAEDPVRNR